MSELKVEYAPTVFSKGYHCEDDVPVVRLEALRPVLEHLTQSTHGYQPDACSGCDQARHLLEELP